VNQRSAQDRQAGSYSGLPDGKDFTEPQEWCYSVSMATKPPKRSHPGRRGNAISLHPLTPQQALAGLLKISPKDVKAIKAEESKAMRRK
jgi:hypothetical protein